MYHPASEHVAIRGAELSVCLEFQPWLAGESQLPAGKVCIRRLWGSAAGLELNHQPLPLPLTERFFTQVVLMIRESLESLSLLVSSVCWYQTIISSAVPADLESVFSPDCGYFRRLQFKLCITKFMFWLLL